MENYIEKDGKKLRLGYTTGSCAAAASKAATFMLLSGIKKERIKIDTPKGITLELDVLDIKLSENTASCAIKKDGGDDPDITTGALIYATVSLNTSQNITIYGGFGVGRITKPGLDQAVGNAAINSVPRKMIKENIKEVCKVLDYKGGLDIVISVPEGEKLAKKTFNPRLGIEGGISIIGTTGIVEPMSDQALIDTIKVELSQRRASGADYVLLTPGNYGSDFIKMNMDIDAKVAVLMSNFVGDALLLSQQMGFKGALLIGHIGKFVKLAGNIFNTHSKYGDCRMEIIASHAGAAGLNRQAINDILHAATTDEAIRILDEHNLRKETLNYTAQKICYNLDYKTNDDFKTGFMTFSKVYGLLSASENAEELLHKISREGNHA